MILRRWVAGAAGAVTELGAKMLKCDGCGVGLEIGPLLELDPDDDGTPGFLLCRPCLKLAALAFDEPFLLDTLNAAHARRKPTPVTVNCPECKGAALHVLVEGLPRGGQRFRSQSCDRCDGTGRVRL